MKPAQQSHKSNAITNDHERRPVVMATLAYSEVQGDQTTHGTATLWRSIAWLLTTRSLRELIQALEHSIEVSDRLADVVRRCLDSQRSGIPLDPGTVAHYEEQLAVLAGQRARLQEAIARWWTILGKTGSH